MAVTALIALSTLCLPALGEEPVAVAANRKAEAPKEEPKDTKLRTWTDSTGKRKVKAELLEVKDGKAVLRREDGKTVAVPLDGLSKADHEYVKSEQRQNPERRMATNNAEPWQSDFQIFEQRLLGELNKADKSTPFDALNKIFGGRRVLWRMKFKQTWLDKKNVDVGFERKKENRLLLKFVSSPDARAAWQKMQPGSTVTIRADIPPTIMITADFDMTGRPKERGVIMLFLNVEPVPDSQIPSKPVPSLDAGKPPQTFQGICYTGFILPSENGLCYPATFFSNARYESPSADPKRPSSNELLDSVAVHGGDLKDKVAAVRAVAKSTGVSVQFDDKPSVRLAELVAIIVCPMQGTEGKNRFKNPLLTFIPGEVKSLPEVIAKYGEANEKEVWSWELSREINLDGLVSWWGDVGLATDKDGTISHVLVRQAPTKE